MRASVSMVRSDRDGRGLDLRTLGVCAATRSSSANMSALMKPAFSSLSGDSLDRPCKASEVSTGKCQWSGALKFAESILASGMNVAGLSSGGAGFRKLWGCGLFGVAKLCGLGFVA